MMRGGESGSGQRFRFTFSCQTKKRPILGVFIGTCVSHRNAPIVLLCYWYEINMRGYRNDYRYIFSVFRVVINIKPAAEYREYLVSFTSKYCIRLRRK